MSRVFVARLADLPVLDPYGDQIGRVRDVALRLRSLEAAPRVTGLVVEIQQRRRIFVPFGRVTSFDPDAVFLNTPTVDLQRFSQHPGELLVLADLLDRPVTIKGTNEGATLVDIAIEQTRGPEWYVTKVAVRAGVNRLGRRSALRQLNWDEITGVIHAPEFQGAAALLASFEQLHPADLAHVLRDLSDKRRREVVAALDDARLAEVLEELPESDQVGILSSLNSERAADVLEEMSPDDAADLLGELPGSAREQLLELMRPSDAADMRRLLHYPRNTAGGLMTTEPVILAPDATVAQALARIQDADLAPVLAAQVYVCRPPSATPSGPYVGTAHFQRLLREPPSTLVSSVLDTDLDPLPPGATVAVVSRQLATYNLMALPVVDAQDRLLGAVTIDDVLDHLLPDDWREADHG